MRATRQHCTPLCLDRHPTCLCLYKIIWLCRLRGVFSMKRPKYLGKDALIYPPIGICSIMGSSFTFWNVYHPLIGAPIRFFLLYMAVKNCFYNGSKKILFLWGGDPNFFFFFFLQSKIFFLMGVQNNFFWGGPVFLFTHPCLITGQLAYLGV